MQGRIKSFSEVPSEGYLAFFWGTWKKERGTVDGWNKGKLASSSYRSQLMLMMGPTKKTSVVPPWSLQTSKKMKEKKNMVGLFFTLPGWLF